MARVLNHPQALPAMYFRRIGEISYRWNMIELYMQTLTWHFLGLDFKKGRLLTYWPGQQAKLAAFKALPQKWVSDSETAREICQIAKNAAKLKIRRNNIVHGIWGHEPGRKDELRLFEIESVSDRILPRAKLISKNELTSQAQALERLQKRLVALHKRVGAPLP